MLALCHMDCMASHGDTSTLDWVREYKQQLRPEEVRPEPMLSGTDLIAMGYTPGPGFREMLTAVEDAQLEGAISSKDEAMDFVSGRWRREE